MSSTDQFRAEAAKIASEIRQAEERARKVAEELERKKGALLDRATKHFAAQLDTYREQALAYLSEAREALTKLGPAPTQPKPDGCEPSEFVARCEAYDAANAEHDKGVVAISTRLHRACVALHRQASDARREARELGVESRALDGVAFVPEHVRHHSRYSDHVSQWLGSLGYAHPMQVSAQRVGLLIAALSEPVPEPQAPSPTYPAGVAREPGKDGGVLARGWARISEALSDYPPAKPVQTQTERDADRVMQRSPEEQRYATERQQGIRP